MHSYCHNYVKILQFDEHLFIFLPLYYILHLLLRIVLSSRLPGKVFLEIYQVFLRSSLQSLGHIE